MQIKVYIILSFNTMPIFSQHFFAYNFTPLIWFTTGFLCIFEVYMIICGLFICYRNNKNLSQSTLMIPNMNRIKLIAILLSAIYSSANIAGAQQLQMSASSDAWLDRAEIMYNQGNYTAAMHQLAASSGAFADIDYSERSQFLKAMCSYQLKRSDTPLLLHNFIENFPESAHRIDAELALANYYFFNGNFVTAIELYSALPAMVLNGKVLADYNYRYAFSLLQLQEYSDARRHFTLAAADSRYARALVFYDAYILYARGNYSEALSKFNSLNRSSILGKEAQYYIVQILYHNEEYDQVISLGNQILASDPPERYIPELTRITGESLFYAGEVHEASEMLSRYFGLCKNADIKKARSAMYVMGVITWNNDDPDGTINYMNGVTSVADALSQSAYLYLGQAYTRLDNNSAASLAFEKAMNMEFEPTVRETAFFNYAVAQSKGARTPFGSAITNFEEFLNRYPDSQYRTRVEEFLIDAYIHGNDYKKAYESINRIQKPSKEVLKAKQYVLYNLGINAANSDDDNDAVSYLNDAVQLGNYNNKVYASCLLWLADCMYRKGNYAEAGNNYAKYLDLVKNRDEFYYKAYYNLAYTKYQRRKYSAAREDFTKAVAGKSNLDNRTRADAYSRIGDTYYYEKRYADASSAYARAIDTDPESGDYAMLRRSIVTGLQRRHSEKISIIDQMLHNYPNSVLGSVAMLEKADAQISSGKSHDAITTFQALLNRYPSSPEARKALLQLAITYKSDGDETEAINNYKKVVQKYPSSEEAALAVEDLKILFAERGEIESLEQFLSHIPNAPKIETDELDRLEFAAAERAYIGDKGDIVRIHDYIKKYPTGEYRTNALYYIATEEYKTGNYDQALTYINDVLTSAADASFAENALAMKGNILAISGRHPEAFETFTTLMDKASTPDNRTRARLGIMRSGYKTRHYTEAAKAASHLLAGSESGLSADEQAEAKLTRGNAYFETGDTDKAISDWQSIANEPRNLYGAQAAVALAQHYFDNKNYDKAETILNSLIDSGTPHTYWLARGFIIFSDVLAAKGNVFEAREYLESLKNNYPGSEKEIFDMIDSRLSNLKNK